MASKLAHLRTTVLFQSLLFFPRRRCSSSPPSPAAPPHPWPEWVQFVDWLTAKGYFTGDSLSESNREMVYRDMNLVTKACLGFARDRYDHIKWLSKRDIDAIVGGGCPTPLKEVANSGKRLRARIGLDEVDACSSCNLRGCCDRAYVTLPESECNAKTLDVVRVLMFYALDPMVLSGFKKPAGRGAVEASARKLLSELVWLSQKVHAPAALLIPVTPVAKKKEEPLCFSAENQNKSRGDWHCSKCNYLNFSTNLRCLKCNNDRPKSGPNIEIVIREGDWACPRCSFMNFSKNKRCFKCQADGPVEDEDDIILRIGDWKCTMCRFLNFASNRKCLSCREPRPKRHLDAGEWECPACDKVNFSRNTVCWKCKYRRPRNPEIISGY